MAHQPTFCGRWWYLDVGVLTHAAPDELSTLSVALAYLVTASHELKAALVLQIRELWRSESSELKWPGLGPILHTLQASR